MADRNILFNDDMIAALLAGRKTQTRRLLAFPGIENVIDFVKVMTDPQGRPVFEMKDRSGAFVSRPAGSGLVDYHYTAKIGVGDRLYVCETHYRYGHWEPKGTARTKGGKQKWHFVEDSPEVRFVAPADYRRGMHNADPYTPAWHKRLGRFMFKKHSRLTIQITDVKIERLRSIGPNDAIAEGLQRLPATGRYVVNKGDQYFGLASHNPCQVYSWLWDGINPDHPWEANPWVMAYTFVTINANIEQIEAAA